MGAGLSTAQKDVYYKVTAILMVVDSKFSKAKLQQFLKALSVPFPHTSSECVTDIQFWNEVDAKFINLAKKETKNSKIHILANTNQSSAIAARGVHAVGHGLPDPGGYGVGPVPCKRACVEWQPR